MTVITDSNNEIIFPTNFDGSKDLKFKVPGFNAKTSKFQFLQTQHTQAIFKKVKNYASGTLKIFMITKLMTILEHIVSEHMQNFERDSVKSFIITNNKSLIFEHSLTLQFTNVLSEPAFTSSKLTMETLEHGGDMFKVKNIDTGTTLLASFWGLYC